MSDSDSSIEEKIYLNALANIPGVGARTLHNLLDFFKSAEAAWKNDDVALLKKAKLRKATLDTWSEDRRSLNPSVLWEEVEKHNIKLITYADKNYPEKLKTIPLPPALLYARGTPDFTKPSIAIVGSRAHTDYGERAAQIFSSELAHADVTIISGLALGIDALAHEGALTAHGHTIGILGGGVDSLTMSPYANTQLGERVLESGGAIISEYPPGMKPTKGSFPARNRIMAGLTDATLVVEARKRSGTLITARLATKYGRILFVVPRSIFSEEPHRENDLIANENARIASCAGDILSVLAQKDKLKNHRVHFQKTKQSVPSYVPKNATEKSIMAFIMQHADGIHVDRIIKHTTLETTTVSSALTILEISGAITDVGGQVYRCK